MNKDEGCNLKGYCFVDAVPESFHKTSDYYGNIIQRLANEIFLKVNINHKINQLILLIF